MNQELLGRCWLDESDMSSVLLRSKVYVEDCAATNNAKHIGDCGQWRDAFQDQGSIIMVVLVEIFLPLLLEILSVSIWLSISKCLRSDGVVVELCKVIVIRTVGAWKLPGLLEIRRRLQVSFNWWKNLIA